MKKVVLMLVAITMVISSAFMAVGAAECKFSDVTKNDWYYDDVMSAVNLGLINGKGSASTYLANDNLTYAEAIKLAACMNQLYVDGIVSLKNGTPWYKPYVDYCMQNGIINKVYNYNDMATRSGYMSIFANALPDSALKTVNKVEDNSIPDVSMDKSYSEAIYKLYRAGIVAGSNEEHSCKPLEYIKRSEVAAILSRMMDGGKRVRFTMGEDEESISSASLTCTHSLKRVKSVEATCSSEGNIEYWHCDNCNGYFTDDAGTNQIKPSGIIEAPVGHVTVIDEAVQPSITGTGLTEGAHCSVCKKVIVEQKVVPKLNSSIHSILYKNLKGAESPVVTRYAEGVGLMDIPAPTLEGYEFVGWYTRSVGGEIVDYIPAKSKDDYILFARWEKTKYNITYLDAPVNNNPETYTIESEIKLSDPTWPGLVFVGWTDSNGKPVTRISKGTTGELVLVANWKKSGGVANTNVINDEILVAYDEKSDNYHFIYELGTIEHVVLDKMGNNNVKYNNQTADLSFALSESVSIEDSVAESIATTVSKSVSSTKEWSKATEWATEHSTTQEASVSGGVEFDIWGIDATIEATYGNSRTDTQSWGTAITDGRSDTTGKEESVESASTVSYAKSITSSIDNSFTISSDMPKGYYAYVHAGNLRVFAVVTYDSNKGNYYLDTYSVIDNMHETVLYGRDYNELVSQECEELPYDIPKDRIKALIDDGYNVIYDANGGNGTMASTYYLKNVDRKIGTNTFTNDGYDFGGWELHTDSGIRIIKPDETVKNLADKGETVTLFAIWVDNNHTVTFELNKSDTDIAPKCYTEPFCSISRDAVIYGSEYKLPVPSAENYTFDGWYTDPVGGTKVTDGKWNINEDTTLFAHWKKNAEGYTYIKTVDDLNSIRNAPDGNYLLVADISSLGEWTPIPVFRGHFNGNGKTLSGMTITIPSSKKSSNVYYGLFAENHGTVENLKVTNSTIHMEPAHNGDGWIFAGIICGYNSKDISDVHLSSVEVSVHRDKSEAGGISGTCDGTIKSCTVNGNSLIYGNGDLGGITGGLCGTVDGCVAENITVKNYIVNHSRSSGGIVGYNNNGTIKNSSVLNIMMILTADSIMVDNFLGSNSANIGWIVGTQDGGVIQSVGKDDRCVNKIENYDHNYGLFGWGYDNTGYFKEGWGYSGKNLNNPKIS